MMGMGSALGVLTSASSACARSEPELADSITTPAMVIKNRPVRIIATAYADFPLNYAFPREQALDGARAKIIKSLGAK